MRISRVYFDRPLELDEVISLPPETSHYLSKVLRLRVDDKLLVFNEASGEFLARVGKVGKKEIEIKLLEQQRSPATTSGKTLLKINLLLGFSRGDRMDFAVQKSTELGVTEISPVFTEHGEAKLAVDRVEKKLQHWRKIAISACEQSGRLNIPLINNPTLLRDTKAVSDDAIKLMLDPGGCDLLPAAVSGNSIALLIGPEGGFSSAEVAWARDKKFNVISLGPRILRAETAPIAALAILQHRYGDM